MHKLKLELDDLRVESFDTSAVEEERGSVFGEAYTEYANYTCPGFQTCGDPTCGCSFTCPVSCNGTCTLCTELGSCYTCPDP